MTIENENELEQEPRSGLSDLTVGLGAWISTGIVTPDCTLPDDKTPVLLLFYDGERRIGELLWERPTWEETFQAFQYWDAPENDGQEWDWADVIGWMPLPEAPN